MGVVNGLDKLASIPGYPPAKTGVTVDNSAYSVLRGEGPGSYIASTLIDGATITFVCRGSTVAVYYVICTNCGNFTVTIDGVLSAMVNATGTNTIGNYNVSGLAQTNHNVTVYRIGGQPSMYMAISGVRGTNPTGVIVDNYSIVGCTASLYITRNSVQYGEPAYWSGGPGIPSDLFIYALIVNDAAGQGLAAATADAYATTVNTHLARVSNDPASSFPNILFIMPHIGNYQNAAAVLYYLLLGRIYDTAKGYGAAVINLAAAFKNSWTYGFNKNLWGAATPDGTGSTGNNVVHPGDVGMAQYASIIIPYLNLTSFQPSNGQ